MFGNRSILSGKEKCIWKSHINYSSLDDLANNNTKQRIFHSTTKLDDLSKQSTYFHEKDKNLSLPELFGAWYHQLGLHRSRMELGPSLEDWVKHQPLSILQLDPPDRIVLFIAGK